MLKLIKHTLVVCSILTVLSPLLVNAKNIEIRHNKVEGVGAKEEYQFGLLKLALSYDKENTYTYKPASQFLPQSTMVEQLKSDRLDVVWTGTSKELEAQIQPIRIPLYKGLLGHRIFIIREGNQYKFDNVNTFAELKQLTAAQERTWADTKILRSAGIPVIGTRRYENLFYMLEGGRYDYFPRGVHEPWSEIAARPELPLTVEKRILVKYPMPAYLWVQKGNYELAQKIESGLRQAIEDGSFDAYFFGNPMIKDVIEKAHLTERVVFEINNPFVPDTTPFDDKSLWLDISQLK
ncbi:transporter substrate-binding domain-containing protein [Catenovulum sp. 2E275]|uniref:transporter substrate-binding domain-containing protein n=1 Tax=Catenovulum sp. 2E275 TaxID=2980497 RepID=UPI0021D13294|nr:transporter substrate-binding domain-containing protein [Catenovulum sp. 2E275]MCU4676451.1 transporter substrate-binding domain-containing protein [Catenovulum sp. 2E275]